MLMLMMRTPTCFVVFVYLVVAGFETCTSKSISPCPYYDMCSSQSCPYGLGFETDEQGCVHCRCRRPLDQCPKFECPKFTCFYGLNEPVGEDGCVKSCGCNEAPEACPRLDCRWMKCAYGLNTILEKNGCVNSCKCRKEPIRNEPKPCPQINCMGLKLTCPYGLDNTPESDGCINSCKCKKPPSSNGPSRTLCPKLDCSKLTCPNGLEDKTPESTGCVTSCMCKREPSPCNSCSSNSQENEPALCPELDCSEVTCPYGLDDTLEANGCVNSCKCRETSSL